MILICFPFLLFPVCVSKSESVIDNDANRNENLEDVAEKNKNTTNPDPIPTVTANEKLENHLVQQVETDVQALEISPELYDKTFNEIDLLIKKLNIIIQKKNYNEWLKYLTAEYIREKKDPAYLKEVSLSPALKSKNLILFDLKDYFFYVIVPSNANALLEKISFIDNNHVKAYGTIFNKSGILYYFEKIDEQWKIGIFK